MGQYIAGLYLRLSKDDGTDAESASIQTQKTMLTRYCRDNGISIYDYYIDDGFSGTNFNRPRFNDMLADIETNKINCVITKDLSRLGRNYLQTGMYIEVYFPEHGVRYISLNDGVDTLSSANMDITPFKNLINDMYAKDISKKIKSAIIARQKQGKYMGTKAPYGYLKDPNDHNHLIIDERYAPVVRRIFALAKEGMGIAKIRRVLTADKIPRPAAVAYEQGFDYMDRNQYGNYLEDEENRYTWSNNSVRDILRNPVYAGHIAGQKRPKRSMKTDKRYRPGSEKYFVVENVHEPIIPPEEWELVQQLITSRRIERKNEKYDNIFSGLIKCGTCGYAMSASHANRRKRPEVIDCITYTCSNYRTYGKEACSKHTLEARDLHDAVLADIRKHAKMALENDDRFIKSIINKLNLTSQKENKAANRELKKAKSRLSELDKLFAKLYDTMTKQFLSKT
ncbi:MAG: recombinase family protein, partial [Candidatus Ornithomonoglobus sp.]